MREFKGIRYSDANGPYWLAALLLGLLLVLLVLILSWLLRTIAPVVPSISVAVVDARAPIAASPASLLTEEANAKRLTAQLTALSADFMRKTEQCAPSALSADRWATKDLRVLQGCWFLGREVPTALFDLRTLTRQENCIVKVGRVCFDTNGYGRHEQTVTCPRAGTVFCSAPLVGQFGADGSFKATQPTTLCQGSYPIEWGAGSLSCSRVNDDHALCRRDGIPEPGSPPQDLEFRRTRQ